MSHGDVVLRAVDAIRRADAASYAQLFAEDAVLHSPLAPLPVTGRDAILEAEQNLFDAFSEIDIEVIRLITDRNSAAAEIVIRAVNTGSIDLSDGEHIPATGSRIELHSVWLFDFGPDGLVVAERDYFDTASFMSQLGLEM